MQKRKLALCAAVLALVGCASNPQLVAFSTDGCSLFPDGMAGKDWEECCVRHDAAYWAGGSAAERYQADAALGICVLERSDSRTLATLMVAGVRLGGLPLWPTPFRWAYGWPYGRGYAPLLPEQRQQADALLAMYWAARGGQGLLLRQRLPRCLARCARRLGCYIALSTLA